MGAARKNYYRATFRRDVMVPGPNGWQVAGKHEWSDLVFEATNYDEARDHAKHHANVIGVVYCTVQRLDRTEGQRLIGAEKLLKMMRAI